MVATKQKCGRKFLHQVLWHSLAKLCTKNYENPYMFVKVTVNQWHLSDVDVVYMPNGSVTLNIS